MIIRIILFIILAAKCYSYSAPAAERLALHKEKKECFVYFPGDENYSVTFKNLGDWRLYVSGYNNKVITSYGECDYSQTKLQDCCAKLGFKLLTEEESKAYLKEIKWHKKSTSGAIIKPTFNDFVGTKAGPDGLSVSFVSYVVIGLLGIIVGGLFLYLRLSLLKKIKNQNSSNKLSLFLVFIYGIYPIICVGIAFFKTYGLVMDNPSTANIIAAIFMAVFIALVVLVTTLIFSLLSLFFVSLRQNIIAAILLLINLIFSISSLEYIIDITKTYNQKYVKPKLEQQKMQYAQEMKLWPKTINYANLPKQIEVAWLSDKEFTVKNLFPVKIYLNLRIKNLDKLANSNQPYKTELDYCEPAYDIPIEPNEMVKLATSKCAFPVSHKGFGIRIRSDIGYSAMSEENL